MAMKIPFVGLATAVLAVGAPVGSVVAQTQQQLDCEHIDMEGSPNASDLIINGCTAVIESGKFTGKDLANIFNSRGNAYAMKREFDRAIADYDQAIRLAPNNPGPFMNRAHAKWGKAIGQRVMPTWRGSNRCVPRIWRRVVFPRGRIFEKNPEQPATHRLAST